MLNIEIKTIPHDQHRYSTTGDYWDEGEKEIFRVSNLSDWRFEFLVAFHELIEKAICRYKNIPVEVIDKFDMKFDKDSSPGDEPMSPYYEQHQIAMGFERMMATMLGVDWEKYENEVNYNRLKARDFLPFPEGDINRII